ncbi:MAG: fibronectin type III domain-containing protein [Candidatus Aminicenantes bacterium]|nr:fibronectin type III domain-containing protein [Candidatus Aminicenantes bacterium]
MDKKFIPVLITVMLVLSVNCGKKGPLKLEPEILPLVCENLALSQVGANIRLQWDFPKKLSDDKTNLEIEKITRVEIYYSGKDIPVGKFLKKSTLLRKLEKAEIASLSVLSAQSPLTFSVEIPFKIQDLNAKSHFFGLRYLYGKKKSPLSGLAAMVAQTPVKPIDDLQITRENKLIKLKWSKPQSDVSGMPIANIAGYKISRRIKPPAPSSDDAAKTAGELFRKINYNPVLNEYFADGDTGRDGEYQYYVSTMTANDIESGPSPIASVAVSDIYPPEIPANLVSFKGGDHLFLTWKAPGDSDLSHYRIYRKSTEEGEFTLLADQVTGNQYKDKDVKKGTLYFYVVTAVDNKGNESQYSTAAKEEF